MKWKTRCERRELQKAWADWIQSLRPWKLFVNLTMRDSLSDGKAGWTRPGYGLLQKKWGEFLCYLEVSTGHEPFFFKVIELQEYRKVYHIHALVDCDGVDIARTRAWAWKHIGLNKISEYCSNRGAESYCCKYLIKDDGGQGLDIKV